MINNTMVTNIMSKMNTGVLANTKITEAAANVPSQKFNAGLKSMADALKATGNDVVPLDRLQKMGLYTPVNVYKMGTRQY